MTVYEHTHICHAYLYIFVYDADGAVRMFFMSMLVYGNSHFLIVCTYIRAYNDGTASICLCVCLYMSICHVLLYVYICVCNGDTRCIY